MSSGQTTLAPNRRDRRGEKYTKCFNLVIRHGERCDNSALEEENKRVEVEWDPPLTTFGLL